jgi:hypothetical protein
VIVTVDIEAKNLLAKLLASENIWIQHKKVETASFDMTKRILTFPMWKDMSDCVYTMLAGHEVGHALYSYDSVEMTLEEKRAWVKVHPHPAPPQSHKRVNVDATAYAKRIDPNNIAVAGEYWNIIEDARIERLVKEPYPGLKSVFAAAYQELVNNDVFGIKGQDLNKLPLIDRINIYFKAGHLVTLRFDIEEEALVHKVAATMTMEDVVTVTKEIYDWSKKNELQPPPPVTMKMTTKEFEKWLDKNPQGGSARGKQQVNVEIEDPENLPDDLECDEKEGGDEDGKSGKGKKSKSKKKPGKEGDEDGEGDGKEGDEEKPGKGKGKGKDGKEEEGDDKDGKGKGKGKGKDGDKKDAAKNEGEDESGEGEGDDSEGDGEGGDDEADGGDEGDSGGSKSGGDKDGDNADDAEGTPGKKVGTTHRATKPVDPQPGPPPSPQTQRNFDHKIQGMRDPNAQEIVYVTLPKPNLKNIIVDFDVVHKGIRAHFKKDLIETAEKEFGVFRDAQMPIINYILQQFEMRKQADRYKRTRQHKTGSLDTLRLCYYKTEEDLFKTIAVCQDGKNHGLIFVVDWSGSMSSSMAGTIEQLILLCLFCRKASIPFEVYSLTTGGRNAFSQEPGNLQYAQNFSMRTYLSSRMIPGLFHDACVNLFAMMPGGRWGGGPTADNLTGCTPLDESIITAIDLIKEFKRKTGAQIVNAIFLTDGGANTVNSYFNDRGTSTGMGYNDYIYNYGYRRAGSGSSNVKYLIDDRETHKTYSFTVGDMTPTMVKILRDRNNIHAVCFYIDGSWENFFTSDIDDVKRAAIVKQFAEDGYVISTEWGFNEMYITQRGDVWRVKDTKLRPQKVEVGTPEYMKKVMENFKKQGLNMMKQRIMLDRFIQMIA